MFGKKKSTVPDESKRPGLELSEMVGLFFSFLWFHRGILLFGVVLWGLYYVLTMAKDTVTETKRRDAAAPVFVYVPRPVESETFSENRLTSDAKSSMQRVPLPTEPMPAESMPAVRSPEKKVAKPKLDPKSIRFKQFLATANADSLMRRYAVLMRQVPDIAAFDAVGNIKNCEKICQCLRGKKLSSEQQLQLASMELESISQFDAINVQHKLGIPGLRDRVTALASSLYDHQSAELAAKAHLAIFASHAVDLIFEPTREKLWEFTRVYESHVDGILRSSNTAVVTAELLLKVVQRHQFDEAIALRRDMANRLLSSDVVDFDELGVALRERMIFGDLGLASLSTRFDGMSEEASRDIEILCERLERFPDTRQKIYQFAFVVLDKYVSNEQFDQASALLNALQQIQPKIPNPKTKDWLGENLLAYAEKINLAQVPQ